MFSQRTTCLGEAALGWKQLSARSFMSQLTLFFFFSPLLTSYFPFFFFPRLLFPLQHFSGRLFETPLRLQIDSSGFLCFYCLSLSITAEGSESGALYPSCLPTRSPQGFLKMQGNKKQVRK